MSKWRQLNYFTSEVTEVPLFSIAFDQRHDDGQCQTAQPPQFVAAATPLPMLPINPSMPP